MASDAGMTKLTAARVLLILGALLSLCVSDNVGPRLLPLPLAPERASAPSPSGVGASLSPAPSRGSTAGARVEMVSAPQSRAGAERHPPQATAPAPKFEPALPSAARPPKRGLDQPSAVSPAPLSRPEGRAPPRRA